MIETFGLETQPDITDGGMRSLSVSHDETTGNWQVNASLASKLDEETIRKYGLGIGAGRNPFEVVSGALNATTSNLTKPDPDDPTGKRRVRDAQATALLYQKRHTVEQAFTEWVWTDPARTRMLEDVYNTRFNRIHPREYDGSYLTFPGISTDIDLYDHQRNASRGSCNPRKARSSHTSWAPARHSPASPHATRRNVWAVPPSR